MITEFKIGDFVLCKKDFNEKYPFTKKIMKKIFTKGSEYRINYADYWNLEKSVYVYGFDNLYTFYDGTGLKFETIFKNSPHFYNYFYTKKEIRKIKIDNIIK